MPPDAQQHGLAAAVAGLFGLFPGLDVLHLLEGPLQVLRELPVELVQRGAPVALPLLDLVQLFFHPGRVADVEDVLEALD